MMFKDRFTNKWILALSLGVLTAKVLAAPIASKLSVPHRSFSPTGWFSEAWDGDDRPYRKMRAEIRARAVAHQLTTSEIHQYTVESRKDIKDPQKLFRWTFASYEAKQVTPPIILRETPFSGAFDYVASPHTYEFARVRFLISSQDTRSAGIIALGKRLLRHNSDDYNVQYALIGCYKPWESAQQKQEALDYANDLVRKNSQNPSAYAALGDVYFVTWVKKHQPADATQASTSYEKYLSISPPDSPSHVRVAHLIKLMQPH